VKATTVSVRLQISLFALTNTNKDASAHLQNFLEISSTITIKDVAQDIILLHLFPFSLVERAKQWFYTNKEDINT
jgi:hypothetical protein